MKNPRSTVRLDKYLANSGVISRRSVSGLLKSGMVLINGQKAILPGTRIDPIKDLITVDGKKLQKNANLVYLLLNKPLNVVSTTSDEMGRKTVVEMVETPVRVYPVGRLDADSIGLILLTSDGELTHKLTHPRYHIDKTYEVLVKGDVTPRVIKLLQEGVLLKDGKTAPAKVRVLEEFKFTTKLEIIIHEGRNRQIRRMCAVLGLEVLELKRVAIGKINLGDLGEGQSRPLSPDEIEILRKQVEPQ